MSKSEGCMAVSLVSGSCQTYQVLKALWYFFQIRHGCCTYYPGHSLQCKLDWLTLYSRSCNTEIRWKISARECCSTHHALLPQCFVQYQIPPPGSNVLRPYQRSTHIKWDHHAPIWVIWIISHHLVTSSSLLKS